MTTTPPPSTSSPQPITPVTPRASSVWDIYFPRQTPPFHAPIYLASFPIIMYFWPTITIFYLAALFQGAFGLSPSFVGWIAVFFGAFNFIVLVHDFDQKRFAIFVLSLVVFWLLVWIVSLYGFTFLQSFALWILSFQPTLSTDAYLVTATLLLLLYIWGLLTPLFSYWRLEPNEFVHYSQPVGRDMSIARVGCTVVKEVPDIFECILSFGGGSLVVRRENSILARIDHVPFLGMRMQAIEHMLSETRVVLDTEKV